jgi:hypothetical protein
VSTRRYSTPHDRAIKAANWAMQEDPECAAAHRRRLALKQELAIANRHEVQAVRAAYEAGRAEWERLTIAVFDRVMAEAGFPQSMPQKAGAA